MEENLDSGDRLVCARIYATLGVASIGLGMLRANGIPCILDNAIVAGVLGVPVAAFDGIRLMVHERDLSEALKLLGPDRYPEG